MTSYGWHAYWDGKKRLKPLRPSGQHWARLQKFLEVTALDNGPDGPPMIFLTEQGPVYAHETTPVSKLPLLSQDQATLLQYAYMNEATQLSDRIRFYAHYQMQGTPVPGWTRDSVPNPDRQPGSVRSLRGISR